MAYADHYYYATNFSGGIIPEGLFSRFAARASAYLDELTMGRIPRPVTDKIKRATCEIAEVFYAEHRKGGASSENNDGYSVVYDRAAIRRLPFDIASTYLADTGLLYRGMR